MSDPDEIRFGLRLPRALHDSLKLLAERQHRSLNSQILHMLCFGDKPPICICRCEGDSEGIGHDAGSVRGCRVNSA